MKHLTAHRPGSVAPRPRRRGITLLEVVLSLAIFLFSLAAIAQLIRLAGDQAVQAERKQHGIFLCQSKLAEFAAGVLPMSSQTDQAFDGDDGDWQWSADCSQNQVTNLWQVQVTVTSPGGGNATRVTVTRMLLDPTTRGNTMDTPSTLSSGSSGSSGTSSGSSPSSSSGTGGGM
jgi:type II secretion system protein I